MANGRGQEREKVFEHIVWGFTINLRALVAEWVMFDLVVSMGKKEMCMGSPTGEPPVNEKGSRHIHNHNVGPSRIHVAYPPAVYTARHVASVNG